MNRRQALRLIAASTSASLLRTTFAQGREEPAKTGLGLVIYCCQFRRKTLAKATPPVNLSEPMTFLEHCKSLGAGGMQIRLGVINDSDSLDLRKRAEANKQYIEAIVSVPKDKLDLERFDAEIMTAAAVGAKAVRTMIIPGRRYEYFESLEMFREFDARGRKTLELAAPIVERHRVPLAVENHKDHRNGQRVALFEHISSEFVGACVDTGNSFALLEDPVETAKALAPWAHSVHLKDQSVQMYDDGFLLGDIPLGQGFVDLKKIVEILRTEKPQVHFSLELITRDPLKVPVFNDTYWRTLPDVPATDLVRTLNTVRAGTTDNLQYISRMSAEQQLAREDANVRMSLDYARDVLGLS
ncbi:MAG: sugar phosphate isomerase/epimerase family protein [Pirellulaceae bacterium]|jgi:sugar phosphate isomerase/epimerase|nr:sugar phosphate isomerase/epimerase family protein [Pirellulaceae bacterium]MDP6721871.1 sugar phosphate isomerase/epimerase family protein [Pirellulaceae bacterium]